MSRAVLMKLVMSFYRKRALKLLIPVAVLGIVYWEAKHELKNMNLGETFRYLRHLHGGVITELAGFALLSVAAMSAYDFVLRRHFRLGLTASQAFRFGWIANTFNNVMGFAGVTGAGLRVFLYRSGEVSASTAAAAIVFLSPAMITGLSLLAWSGIFGLLPVSAFEEGHRTLLLAVWGLALYLPFFVALQRSSWVAKRFNRNGERTPWTTAGALIGASFLEWFLAGVTFWLICGRLVHNVPFAEALGIFTVAAIAGLISMAPGGIGAFDLTALLGLQLLGVQPDEALAVLVLYRLFYYLLPWAVGLALAAFEIGLNRKRVQQWAVPAWDNVWTGWQKIWRYPGQLGFLGDIGAWALGKLVMLSGLLLLLSAATPGLLHRMRFMEHVLSLPVMRLSHELSAIVGIMLLVLSRGISLRIRRAYRLALVLLPAGAAFTFAKGFDVEEAIFVIVVTLLLWISSARFYRISAPFSLRTALYVMAITAAAAAGYYALGVHAHSGGLRHLPEPIRQRLFAEPHEFAVTAAAGLLGSWVVLLALAALRKDRGVAPLPDAEELERLKRFLQRAGAQGNLLTHTLFLGDKSLYWAAGGELLIPYARARNKLVVLGDPIGPPERAGEAIREFKQFADRYALHVVFYQASPKLLSVYHEHGYRFFKLGEEALVPLNTFTLTGKSNAALRSVKNRFVRDGFRFEVVEPPHGEALMAQLKEISDRWLDGRKEKGFSLGWFEPRYLQLAPIALLIDPQGDTIAFVSLMPCYDGGNTNSIDLMRHLPDTPNGTMDFLFVSLLEWSKEHGYGRFNMGMAPLSSVGQSESALREEKAARFVYHYGGHWYGFEGLRRYKDKFDPHWEPRFLAYPATVPLPVLTVELVALIARKARGSS
ncbi:bifunctional lysylphosphatidylglycerol flippase/synthetase MprF [Paenibacillus hodogayensis]|uniref:Phosphatidylglycerol lysyltransferase n=1 Tax=Paenibacillus hodogayensis TaxID=279208 RepID=A0ABV5VYE1_9BACL